MQKLSIFKRIMSFFGFILFVVFGAVLVLNITIITKGVMNPEIPPSICGITPLVVQSGSMSGTQEGHIELGDLIFSEKVEPDSLKEGDVISYMQNSVVITHRIVQKKSNFSGKTVFITKGDLNNEVDKSEVTYDKIIGKYKLRIPKVGDVSMFLQSPLGMGLFIGIPLCAIVLYDIIRNIINRKKASKKGSEIKSDTENFQEEEESVSE